MPKRCQSDLYGRDILYNEERKLSFQTNTNACQGDLSVISSMIRMILIISRVYYSNLNDSGLKISLIQRSIPLKRMRALNAIPTFIYWMSFIVELAVQADTEEELR